MLPAIGALLPFTTKPMLFPWCGLALRAIHVLLLLVHGRHSSFRNSLAEWSIKQENRTGENGANRGENQSFLSSIFSVSSCLTATHSLSKVLKINPNGPGCQQIQMVETLPGGHLIRNIRMFCENPGFAFGFYFPSVASQSPKRVRWSQELNM